MTDYPASGRIALRMHLPAGHAATYKARHDALWPDLRALLKEAGIGDYSIFLHEPTESLFAVMTLSPGHRLVELGTHPVMQRWWAHMGDLMPQGPEGAPRADPLPCMFHLD